MNDLMTPIRISAIAEEHIESFHHCLDIVARERRWLALVKAPSLDDARQHILKGIADDVPRFVALNGVEVIGWCDITPSPHEGFSHSGRLGMGVLDGWRGQGIGRRLMVTTLEKAKQIGLERVELEVFASNEPGIGLYKKAGFAIEGIWKKARKIDGCYEDVIQMALFFERPNADALASMTQG